MKTGVVIQARMGSERLPGKIMKEICGKPLVIHVFERCASSGFPTVFAIPDSSSDDVFADFLDRMKINHIRGSEENVLERYVKTAEKMNFGAVIRVTGDNPLIDHNMFRKLSGNPEIDYAVVSTGALGTGSEYVTLEALKKTLEFELAARHREHVTLFIRENRQLFTTSDIPGDERISSLRLTVDQKEDLELVRWIYSEIWDGKKPVDYGDLHNLFLKYPEKFGINRNVIQKKF